MAKPSRPRALAARLALLSASTVLSLLAAEGAYRLWAARVRKDDRADDAWRRNLRRMNATIYRRSDDPRLVYEPVPGSSVPMPYGAAGFNRASMRDEREHELARGERVRVAVVGDSVVWGEDVAAGDALPRQLEHALDEGRAEVLNFGVTGYDTAQEVAWYERAVAPWRPAVVVVVYCLNDVMIMSGPYNRYATPDEARAKDAQDALLDALAPVRAETLEAVAEREEQGAWLRSLAHARGLWRAFAYERSGRYTDEYLLLYARPERAARVREGLAALGRAVAASGARAHLVISPVLRSWERYHWRGVHAQVAAYARAAGFTVHDPLEQWLGTERAGALRIDSLHYGTEGNRVFARYVAEQIAGDVAGGGR